MEPDRAGQMAVDSAGSLCGGRVLYSGDSGKQQRNPGHGSLARSVFCSVGF